MKITTKTTTIPADLQTPVGIYLKIRDLYPQSALLESSDYHTQQNSVSLIGVDPIGSFKLHNEVITATYPDGSFINIEVGEHMDVPTALRTYLSAFRFEGDKVPGNGLLGYTAYDAVRYFDKVYITKPCDEFKDIPDIYYILYRFIIRVNHYNNEMTIIENLVQGQESRTEEIKAMIHNNNIAQYSFTPLDDISSTITDEDYKSMVEKGIAHARRGDVFQIVLSRRFSQGFRGDEFNVYRALRCVNPSPYLFFFDMGGFKVFGSSPETHLRVEKGKAYIDPIAGTFRRTGDDARDHELANALLADAKENAEHIMLVDLARNDMARSGGKVAIEFLRQVQFYSHVIHLVSRVSATLPDGADVFRLFAGTFPAGTLSGAPKVRAMQLIDEIEPHNRKIYGGCIGFIGFDGSLNQAITIRSFVSTGNRLYSQAGAGIVARSNSEMELRETNNKLGALVKAVEYATTFND
ncbi:MAG: anthranilate synthase component I family protein [Barnesiella sp.]|nr:anthranilate synthase component I family protein [Barnesiella sp.]